MAAQQQLLDRDYGPGMIPRAKLQGDTPQLTTKEQTAAVMLSLAHFMLSNGHYYEFITHYIDADVAKRLALRDCHALPTDWLKLRMLGCAAFALVLPVLLIYFSTEHPDHEHPDSAESLHHRLIGFFAKGEFFVLIAFLGVSHYVYDKCLKEKSLGRLIGILAAKAAKAAKKDGLEGLKYHSPREGSFQGNSVYKFAITMFVVSSGELFLLAIVFWSSKKQLAIVLALAPGVAKYVLFVMQYALPATQAQRKFLEQALRRKQNGFWQRVLEASDDSWLEVTRQELNDLYDNHEELVRTVETDDRNRWFFPDAAMKKNYCSRLYAQNILMTDTVSGEGLVIDIGDLVE